uniref:Cytochrome c biogenesis protein CcsA n=1 Tax=Alsidium seaforthii TaxID=2007182 RepID=A0A1Z1MD95_9FLOR|nr:cytochrome c biogenesis protein ccs1 [Bryothamnion seaforthii]ARW63899.1 cytochrome c biogenesis protein ccs1 [Bryothamnion seaforthii]
MNQNLIENYLINIAFGLLLIGLLINWLNLIINTYKDLSNISNILVISINLTLATILILRWIQYKYFPLSNLYESLIFLSWSLTFGQILIEKRTKNKLVGAITYPISLFIIAFASLCLPNDMKVASPLVPALRSNWLVMHVTVMMISYSTLIIGSLLSILFLIVSHGKRIDIQGNSYNNSKKILMKYNSSEVSRLIDKKHYNYNNQVVDKVKDINLIESLDNLSYRIIGFGFPLLTIGIISGAVWANESWGTYWSWDPKETWALITWIIFAIYLHSRLNKQSNNKTPAIIASLGFIIVWICYLGVNFLGKGLHSYGWIMS